MSFFTNALPCNVAQDLDGLLKRIDPTEKWWPFHMNRPKSDEHTRFCVETLQEKYPLAKVQVGPIGIGVTF
jgi:hypothetical protein